MAEETNQDSNQSLSSVYFSDRSASEYLCQLLKDHQNLSFLPTSFYHAERILQDEINKVKISLLNSNNAKEEIILPEPIGSLVSLSEKIFVPIKEHPDFNFVGRILGPRGMTAKQLEYETGCRIMIRGKGSMRDKAKEEQNRGKPNWGHLNEDLHVLITVEDTNERAQIKLKKAINEIKKLLKPAAEGEDELKKVQLMELAILNGTYKNYSKNQFGRANSYDNSNSVMFSPLRVSVPSIYPTQFVGSFDSPGALQPVFLGYMPSNGFEMGNCYYFDPSQFVANTPQETISENIQNDN